MKTKKRLEERVEVSIVFPAYNEADILKGSLKRTVRAVREVTTSYEIIIAEDGSSDGTDKIASELSKRYCFVKHIHSDKRLGRGNALRTAFKNSRGEILVYMDVDLATDIRYLKTLVESIKKGYDFATGSRMLPESRVDRTIRRRIASELYNLMVRFLLRSKVRDHQCGFKAFRREPLIQILEEVSASHWFWDTEILVRAFRRGYEIKEIPVVWKGKDVTKVSFMKDALVMTGQVLKLWWKLKRLGHLRYSI